MSNNGKISTFTSTPSSIPIVDITEDDAFLTNQGGILDFVQIKCKDLNSAKTYDIEYDMLNWTWLYKSYMGDLKLVSMNYPVDIFEQVAHIDYLISQTKNPVFVQELEGEKLWMQYAHSTYMEQEYYLMFFSKDKNTYKRNRNTIQSRLGRTYQSTEIRLGKKIQILAKMMNMNSSLIVAQETKDIPRGIPAGKNYNPQLLSTIQPQGGISPRDERYIKKGNGYEACIHVFEFPAKVSFNWLRSFSEYENSITTIDIGARDRLNTVNKISGSIDEQLSRYTDARHTTDKFDAQRVYEQLSLLHERIMAAGEVVKRIHIRIFVYESTLNKLDDKVSDILADIEAKGYKAAIFLEESFYEWQSLLLSMSQQDTLKNGRQGNSIPSETLALGHPFHFSSLCDPLGRYSGFTKTKGAVIFNRFQKDLLRRSYSMIVLGLLSGGKSTFLKMMLRRDIIAGNYIRGFATNNEFHKLVYHLGGSIINLDGSDGRLNILHVYKTSSVESACFVKHIERVCMFYKCYVPKADSHDFMTLQEVLRILYKKTLGFDITQAGEQNTQKITGYEPERYPILSDLLEVIHEQMYEKPGSTKPREDLLPARFERLERLEMTFSTIIKNTGNIFNGYSSIREFKDEQIVFFNAGGLLGLGSDIFDAQIHSATNMLTDNMISVGLPQKMLYDAGELATKDIKYFTLYMDEAQNFVNTRKLDAVAVLDFFNREARKLFGSMVLATHKITDFFPTNSTQEGVDAMMNIFSLAQYKVLFQQAPDSIDLLEKVFANELPQKDLEEIFRFEQGECLLNITGVSNTRFHVHVSKKDLELFAGGA